MKVPQNGAYKDYVRYAEHCLRMVTVASDQEYRAVQHEMAGAWLKLVVKVTRLSPRKSRVPRGFCAVVRVPSVRFDPLVRLTAR